MWAGLRDDFLWAEECFLCFLIELCKVLRVECFFLVVLVCFSVDLAVEPLPSLMVIFARDSPPAASPTRQRRVRG